MAKRVAVEQTLTGVGNLLTANGYEVVSLNPVSNAGAQVANCEAVVISGQDSNMVGMEDVITKGTVIQAEGKSPNEILAQVQSRIGK